MSVGHSLDHPERKDPAADGSGLTTPASAEIAFAASSDGLAVLDGRGFFVDVNPAWERLTGIARDRWVGRSVAELQRLPEVSKQSATLRVLQSGAPSSTLVRARDGELLLITASPAYCDDGRLGHVVLNLRNITQLNLLKYRIERERSAAKIAAVRRHRSSWSGRRGGAELDDLVFASPAMEDLLATAAEIADFDSTVLLVGETGTGKGMLARFIHRVSKRAAKPFVEVNCGALPESLVESELFGYEPGTFTGSLRTGKKGQFELAQGGTIFLDEIGDMPPSLQGKLLKVLDDKEVRPLGGASARKLDVRVICATNRNLHELAASGRFRKDLLYRIEVIPLEVPPLRDRQEDKVALLYAFLDRYNRKTGKDKVFSLEAVAALSAYDFPGNVRELRNLVERLVTTTREEEIGVEHLPGPIQSLAARPGAAAAWEALVEESLAEVVDYRERVEKLERQMLLHFARTCRSTYEIARRTGLTQSAVVRRLKKYGISMNPRPRGT